MNNLAQIGHNNPPDPIDTAIEPFGDLISEAENWSDGVTVENEAQMNDVDKLIKGLKAARKAIDDARDAVTKPLHDAWKAEIARWKPTQDDLDRLQKALVAIVDPFKRKLAAEKEAARLEAERAAWEAHRKAQEAIVQASAGDIEAQREAAKILAQSDAAKALAKAAGADTVKGLVTVTRHEIVDGRALVNWIAVNDKAAMTAFITDYAAKNCKTLPESAGVKTWTEKVAR
jgi:hypothetical protein